MKPDELDELFSWHNNGYDGLTCRACGRNWYDDGGHHHLTQLVIELLRKTP